MQDSRKTISIEETMVLGYSMSMSLPIRLTVTFAQSLDGRIATCTGESQWISGERTLRLAHRLRKTHDGILVGIGTVRRDNPELTCRRVRGASPLRVVLDSNLSIPVQSRLVETATEVSTVVICSRDVDENRVKLLQAKGVVVSRVKSDRPGYLNVEDILRCLVSMGLRSLLIEGGSKVITSFLRSGCVDRLFVVTAPILIGEGVPSVGDLGITELSDAQRFHRPRVRRFGQDYVWELKYHG
jgi:5-amino-6-(5-phosphoribosylamino)uracil reductase/diaminohydroxyphosphoribosylaminopyrimidine deaminase/5-amino-6-(5-phosphoribosylamino)uracil reductase